MRAGWWVLALGVAGCTAAAPAGGGGVMAGSTAPAVAAPSAGAAASPVASAVPATTAPATARPAASASPAVAPSPAASGAAVPKVPSFALQVAPVVESKCALCHSSRSPRFVGEDGKTSHALFAGTAVRAHARAAEGSMPPAGPKFTAEEVALLKAWIDAGSPNN